MLHERVVVGLGSVRVCVVGSVLVCLYTRVSSWTSGREWTSTQDVLFQEVASGQTQIGEVVKHP